MNKNIFVINKNMPDIKSPLNNSLFLPVFQFLKIEKREKVIKTKDIAMPPKKGRLNKKYKKLENPIIINLL